MDNIENYWAIANHTIAIINILVEGCLFCKFIQPFMKEKAYYVGISYSLAMLVFYCVPQRVCRRQQKMIRATMDLGL